MLKQAVAVAIAAAVAAGSLTVGVAQASESIDSGAPAEVVPGRGQLDRMFIGQRRSDFNLARLRPLTKPLRLWDNTHLQSMAVVGRNIVTVGLYPETSSVAITTFSLAGRRTGWMRLLNVGHGTSVAAQVHKRKLILWIEADSDRADGDGRGRSLARVNFRSGATLPSRRLQRMKPAPGATQVNPTVDYATRTLAVRYRVGGRTYLDRFNLAAAVEGRYERVSRTEVPLPCNEAFGVIQGWAVSGDFIYCVQGAAGQRTYLGWKNWDTMVSRRYVVRNLARLGSREAEGMTSAMYRGRERVMVGIHLRVGERRYASILTST